MLRMFTLGLAAIQIVVTVAAVWGAFFWGASYGRTRAESEFKTAQVVQAAKAEQELHAAMVVAGKKEREFAMQQQQLNQQITKLQEQLNEPYVSHVLPRRQTENSAPEPVDCRFSIGWLRDYNAAFGVPSATAAISSAGDSDAATWPASGADAEYADAGITQRQLLKHAQQYGAWCIGGMQRLSALQQLLEGGK